MSDAISTRFNMTHDSFIAATLSIGNVSTVVSGSSSQILFNDSGFTTEQNFRLNMLFNSYQQFRLKQVTIRYKPRFMNVTTEFRERSSIEPDPSVVRYQNLFNAHTEFILVLDEDDVQTRNSVAEFYQLRDQPNAVKGNIMTPISLSFVPRWFKLGLQYNQFGIGEANLPTAGGDYQVNTGLSEEAKWMPTKVRNPTGGVIGYFTLNNDQALLGFKYYMYHPYNVDITNTQLTVGQLQFDYQWEFRYPEYRGLYEVPTPPTEEDNATALILGEGAILSSSNDKVHFTALGDAVARKRKAEFVSSGDDLLGDDDTRARARAVLDEATRKRVNTLEVLPGSPLPSPSH